MLLDVAIRDINYRCRQLIFRAGGAARRGTDTHTRRTTQSRMATAEREGGGDSCGRNRASAALSATFYTHSSHDDDAFTVRKINVTWKMK